MVLRFVSLENSRTPDDASLRVSFLRNAAAPSPQQPVLGAAQPVSPRQESGQVPAVANQQVLPCPLALASLPVLQLLEFFLPLLFILVILFFELRQQRAWFFSLLRVKFNFSAHLRKSQRRRRTDRPDGVGDFEFELEFRSAVFDSEESVERRTVVVAAVGGSQRCGTSVAGMQQRRRRRQVAVDGKVGGNCFGVDFFVIVVVRRQGKDADLPRQRAREVWFGLTLLSPFFSLGI